MLHENVHIFARLLRVADAVMLGAGVALVWPLGVREGLWESDTFTAAVLFAAFLMLCFFIVSEAMEIYRVRRTESLLGELGPLLKGIVVATALSCLAVELTTSGMSGLAYGATMLVGTTVLLGARSAVRLLLRSARRRRLDTRNWLIVGRNDRSAQIAQEILQNPCYGIRIAHVVDFPSTADRDRRSRLDAFSQGPLAELPQTELDGPEALRAMVLRHLVDEVVLCLPLCSFYSETEQILRLCGEGGLCVKQPPLSFGNAVYKTQVSPVGRIRLMTHFSGPHDPMSLVWKRLIDVIGAAAGLVLLLPLGVVIAAAIKATSRGPVFFRQQRVGLHGRRFTMFKFRTMVHDAPELHRKLVAHSNADGPAFKMKDDPRVTWIGRHLRKHHLDELPQLWNVLLGEMSLVGPRPLPAAEADANEWWQRRRLSMPPGLTCLWQVHGNYEIPFQRWMELDLEYIDRWSVGLDLRLILATVGTVFRGADFSGNARADEEPLVAKPLG